MVSDDYGPGPVEEAGHEKVREAEPRVTIFVTGKAARIEARRRTGRYADEPKTKPTPPGAKSGSRGACSSAG